MFNFGLSQEQTMIRTTVRDFMEERCPSEFVRTMMDDKDGYPREMWREMAELGWQGLNIPEAYGGSETGFVNLMVIMESIGRSLLPAPFLETVIAAEALVEAGSEAQKKAYLPKIASGELIATLAIEEEEGFWNTEGTSTRALRDKDCYRVSGTKLFVPYAQAADMVICSVRTADEGQDNISLLLLDPKAPGVSVQPLLGMDETYRLCELKLDSVEIPVSQLLGEEGKGSSILEQMGEKAAVLAGAEMIGGTERVLEMAVAYSKERQQFDKLLGSFQAIKHRCADIMTDLESSRALLYYAAWAIESSAGDTAIASSMVKAHASDTYVNATQRALQSFGGIGFTWEHDIHLFLKRARRLAVAFGDATFHRERVAGLWL